MSQTIFRGLRCDLRIWNSGHLKFRDAHPDALSELARSIAYSLAPPARERRRDHQIVVLAGALVAVMAARTDPPLERLQFALEGIGIPKASGNLEPAGLEGRHQRADQAALGHTPHVAVEGDGPTAGDAHGHGIEPARSQQIDHGAPDAGCVDN